MSNPATNNETPDARQHYPWARIVLFTVVGLVALLVGLAAAGVDDVIDLPAWANIDGVDVPLIGDNDRIGCRIQQVDGTGDIEISIFDGDESTYDQYVFVFTHGGILANDQIERRAPDTFITPAIDDVENQFFFISTEPVTQGRLWCGSLPSA